VTDVPTTLLLAAGGCGRGREVGAVETKPRFRSKKIYLTHFIINDIISKPTSTNPQAGKLG